MSNVPPVVFTANGLQVPQESAILAGVQADIDAAFGGGVNPALETPQGQLASSQAAIVADANAVFAEFVNQVNPDTADGFMQDAIARIYFLDRKPGAPTVVSCTCTGALGTVIPEGAQAQDASGNRYVCTLAGVIPVGGTITLTFANVADGPVPCPADTLTQIYQAIPGWDTINNPADGIVGEDVESREAFAYRRQQSVALNARGSLPSIYAAVFDVDDVIDVYVTENFTNAPINVGSTNYPLAPHSLYVAAIGGTASDIANAIWSKKDVGCDMNGNTAVTVTDSSGYLAPLPTYEIRFEIPDALPVLFDVQIVDDPNLPADVVQQVKAAIVNAFNGETAGSTRVRIGSLLVASRFVQYVQQVDSNMAILSIFVGTVTADQTSLLIGIDQAPTVSASDVAVTLV